MTTMLTAALDYAKRGIPVFPCRADNKRPITPNGFYDATTDAKQIKAWWKQYRNAMIGIPCGPASGLWVFDADVDPDKGLDGPEELKGLIAKHGPLPATLASATPRGGTHYFFKWNGADIRNSTSKIAPGLDVRGDGGYVIVPPSVRADGAPYSWRVNFDCPIAEAPTWLLNLIAASSPRNRSWAQRALETECAAVIAAAPGTRNAALNTAAFNLFQLVA